MLENVKLWYMRRPLIQKINILILGAVMCVITVTQGALWYVFQNMKGQILDSYKQSIQLYSTIVEENLKEVDKLSFDLIVNQTVQSSLLTWKSLEKEKHGLSDMEVLYRRLSMKAAMQHLLFSNIGWDGAVGHISIFTLDKTEMGSSELSYLRNPSHLESILDKTAKQKGGSVWTHIEGTKQLIKSRYIRSLKSDTIDQPIGTLLMWVNLDKIVANSVESNPFKGQKMVISDEEGRMLYSSFPEMNEINLEYVENGEIVRYGKTSYVVCNYTVNSGWTYAVLLPMFDIYGEITGVFLLLFMILFLVLGLVILITGKLVKQILTPLSGLVLQMRNVETGNFYVDEHTLLKNTYEDEIGDLCHKFLIMIHKIGVLIQDNYVNQIAIKENQIRALQAQINPHFLYNVLESVNCLAVIGQQPDISTMVKSLTCLMRGAMSNHEMLHSIHDELDLIDSYIAIQKIRFKDKLYYESFIQEDVKGCLIPKFFIQPLIENAVLYGTENREKSCTVQLIISGISVDKIQISIIDNGPGMERQTISDIQESKIKPCRNGIGILNIKQRMDVVFKNQGVFEVESEPGEGTAIHIIIPEIG